MTANDETKQAEMDAQKIDQIQAQILEDYWANCDGYFEDSRVTTMHLKDVLKTIIAGILQRHIEAAIEEISNAMTDEIEALAQDRVVDLCARIEAETGSKS